MKKHIIISGKVQGVGFRYWLYKAAIQRKIDGWVKNKISGEVEALLIGNDVNINNLIALCKKGPPSSKVVREPNQPSSVLLAALPSANI